MYRFSLGFAALALSLTVLPVRAEVLLIDAIADNTAVQTPASGTSMEAVRSRFGEPRATRATVGEPPITRWMYPDFIVYFEHDRVIHAVVRHDRP